MILPEYLDTEVKKFYEFSKISIISDRISEKDKQLIGEFIKNRFKKLRQVNRELEIKNKVKIRTTLSEIIKTLRVDSPIEEILRDALIVEGLGKHLRTQYEIGSKRVDFAFPIAKLVVEADGKEYHRENQMQLERDMQRDKYLARKGWIILHIEGLAIRRNLGLCIEKIKEQLKPFLKVTTQ